MNLTRTIKLSDGRETLVDADDFKELSRFSWHTLSGGGYAIRIDRVNGKRKTVFMHKVIMPSPPGLVTDHINGNPLDNRRANLRICTQGENVRNRRRKRLSPSKYKGVSLVRRGDNVYYRASCYTGPPKGRHLGHYPTEEAAARAYDRRAWELFGEFAKLNFPDEDPSKHPPITCILHRWHGGKECMRCGAPVPAGYRYRRAKK